MQNGKLENQSNGEALSLEINDLNSRLELGKKIIKEKDTQIQLLQDDLVKITDKEMANEDSFNAILTKKNKKLIEQNGI